MSKERKEIPIELKLEWQRKIRNMLRAYEGYLGKGEMLQGQGCCGAPASLRSVRSSVQVTK